MPGWSRSRLIRPALLGAAAGAGHLVMRPPPLPQLDSAVTAMAESLAGAVSEDALLAMVRSLPGPRSRLYDLGAMLSAESFIGTHLAESGLTVERQSFTETDVEGYGDGGRGDRVTFSRLDGVNVIARKQGTEDPDAIVIIAHYDTVRDSPGANDNTSGVVAMLWLARALSRFQFRKSLVFAATDLEERGYFGARRLVPRLTGDYRAITGVNFECVAYTRDEPGAQRVPSGLGVLYPSQVRRLRGNGLRGDFTSVIYNHPASHIATVMGAALARFDSAPPLLMLEPTGLPVLGPRLRASVPGVRQFTRSDHIAFWEAGLPAIQVSDTADLRSPHYHRPTDTAEHLDPRRLRAVALASACLVASIAGLQVPGRSQTRP
jgi:hypothetical protein